MDEVIFEEFKGTGNSEIILDRKISDKRVFPAIDVTKSGTRKEDLLYDKGVLSKLWMLRRILMPMGGVDAMDFLIEKLKQKNLLTRNACENDRRQMDVCITKQGLNLLLDIDDKFESFERKLAVLNEDEANTLNQLLDKLNT
jgi:hypothetical protein